VGKGDIMKLRDKILYMTYGAGLVVLGMVLNTLIDDADAQGTSLGDMTFGYITCKGLIIKDGDKERGSFVLGSSGDAMLSIYGDDGKTSVAYLGINVEENNEMMFHLQSKSKTDKKAVFMGIDERGGRFDAVNKLGESVATLAIESKGGGLVYLRDKYGYKK
jgi:hypothetical protein